MPKKSTPKHLKSDNSSKKIITVGVVGALIIIGGGFYLANQGYLGGKEDGSTNTDGTQEIREGALVASFPSNIPLYPEPIKSSSSLTNPDSNLPEWGVIINTSNSLKTVDSDIRQSYSVDGWELVDSTEHPLNGYTVVAHSDRYIVTITYLQLGDNDTEINYNVSHRSSDD